MTKEKDTWTPFRWYCPNCGNMVIGYKNANGVVKVQCGTCRAVIVRRWKGVRHNIFDLYDGNEKDQYENQF